MRHLTRQPHTAAPRFSEWGRKAPCEATSQSPIHGEVSNIAGYELGRLDTQAPSQTPPSNPDMITNTPHAERLVVSVFQTKPASTIDILDTEISTQLPNSRGRRFSDITTQESHFGALHGASMVCGMNKDCTGENRGCRVIVEKESSPCFSGGAANGDKLTPASPQERRHDLNVSGFDGEEVTVLNRDEAFRFGYKFIFEHTDAALRKILKAWGRRVSGSKYERVARAFLFYRLSVNIGDEPESIFRRCGALRGSPVEADRNFSRFKDFRVWLENKRKVLYTIRDVPDNDVLMRTFSAGERAHWLENEARVDAARRMRTEGEVDGDVVSGDGVFDTAGYSGLRQKVQSGNGTAADVVTFTVSHFARLCLILRDDDEAKRAFSGTGQPLSQQQRDNCVSRYSYLETVSRRFNDETLNPRIDLSGIIENVDPFMPPPNEVPGSKLKTAWEDMQGPFNIALASSEKSDQNDPTTHGFLQYAFIKPNGELRAISKRLVIMFIAMRIARELATEVAEMRYFTVGTIPRGAGFDASGAVTMGGSVLNLYNWKDEIAARKRRRTDDISADTQYLSSTVCHCLDRPADLQVPGSASPAFKAAAGISIPSESSSRRKLLDDIEVELKGTDLLQKLYDQMINTDRNGGRVDNAVYVRAKRQYERIQERLGREFGSD